MSDDDSDLAGAIGTASAASAAMAWVNLIDESKFGQAWEAMTDDFRLLVVQDWIWKNPGVMDEPSVSGTRDELAAELADPSSAHPLRARGLTGVAERGLRSVTTDVLAGREYGAGARPRPMGVDLELIRIMPTDELEVDEHGVHVFAPGQLVECVSLLMRHVDGGWVVAGAAGWLPRPGWPPQYETVVGLAD